ncbi:hypothetical protein ACQEVF_53290 [Nonomuraea polychroma]|uniref:hypothetical protein n=1 Tax=Nonomuraea polychroma TaxID=46176 RepID=UPI003D8B2080
MLSAKLDYDLGLCGASDTDGFGDVELLEAGTMALVPQLGRGGGLLETLDYLFLDASFFKMHPSSPTEPLLADFWPALLAHVATSFLASGLTTLLGEAKHPDRAVFNASLAGWPGWVAMAAAVGVLAATRPFRRPGIATGEGTCRTFGPPRLTGCDATPTSCHAAKRTCFVVEIRR